MSPSGDRIAYIARAGQLEIWNIASRTSEVIIAPAGLYVSTPSWTADGRKIMVVDNERINNRFREGCSARSGYRRRRALRESRCT